MGFGSSKIALVEKDTVQTPTLKGWIISYATYGDKFEMDLFALLHNGARRELVDLYCILSSFVKREDQLTLQDLERFFTWFRVFENYVVEMFIVQAEVIFRWIQLFTDLPKGLTDEERRFDQGEIYEVMNSIRDLESVRTEDEITEVVYTLMDAGDELATRCMKYFYMAEQQIPPLIAQFALQQDKDQVEDQVVQTILQGHHGHSFIPICTRWMGTNELLNSWLDRFLRPRSRRAQYPTWVKNFRRDHVAFAEEMYAKFLDYLKIFEG